MPDDFSSVLKININSDVDIEVVDLDELEVTHFVDKLSPAELNRVSRISFDKHRNRYIVARGLLRQFLGDRLHVRPNSVMFEYGKYGKPMLDRQLSLPNFYFNLSHHENVAVFAFSSVCEVGVDIEAVRDISDADDVAARMFSIREFESYCNLPRESRSTGFFNCWTRKEAFVKAIGAGLDYPLDSFDVSLNPGEPAEILAIRNKTDASRAWKLDSFDISPNYVACLASFSTSKFSRYWK